MVENPVSTLNLAYVTAWSLCPTHTRNTADECLNAAPHDKGWHALPIMHKNRGKTP